jgi:tRNA-splicing ligase RtcB
MTREQAAPPLRSWLAAPLLPEVSEAIARLRRAPDVVRLAVMPDVHLGTDVCVGIALATATAIYPQAVGGDIGCGMLAVAFDGDAGGLADRDRAVEVLASIARAVPARRRHRRATVALPAALDATSLSASGLEAVRREAGALEFATLGGGNHFVELQADPDERLWLMIHSGSRAVGPAIRDRHLEAAARVKHGLRVLDATSAPGEAYLHDAAWARRYAEASRLAMAEAVEAAIAPLVGARLDWASLIATDHNHVVREHHHDRDCWVHRKGAMPAGAGVAGVLPGSMGTASFHVEGRGVADALASSAHGAGRVMSRSAARHAVSERELRRQMTGVCYDTRLGPALRDEAPSAYKDVRAVLRAQRELVRVTRELRPLVTYKGV